MMRTADHEIVCIRGELSHHGLRKANCYLGVVTGGRGLPGIAAVRSDMRFVPMASSWDREDVSDISTDSPMRRARATRWRTPGQRARERAPNVALESQSSCRRRSG